MDEQRIERALREGPPDEPAYRASIATELAAAERTTDAADAAADTSYHGVVRRAGVAPRFRLAGLVAAAVVLAAVALVLRPGTVPGPGSSPDLAARLRTEGTIRIAVTNGHPQTTVAGGSVIGFDVDVAKEIAAALGLRDDIVAMSQAEILAGEGSWDIALPSAALPVAAGLTTGPAYYAWPSWLVVDSRAQLLEPPLEWVGRTICAVSGSEGLAALRGPQTFGTGVIDVVPRSDVTVLVRESDLACAAAIRGSEALYALTAELLFDDELAARGLRKLYSDPAVTARRSILVRGTGPDVEQLVADLDAALEGLRSSGRLADLSRGAFGGRDLSVTGQ